MPNEVMPVFPVLLHIHLSRYVAVDSCGLCDARSKFTIKLYILSKMKQLEFIFYLSKLFRS